MKMNTVAPTVLGQQLPADVSKLLQARQSGVPVQQDVAAELAVRGSTPVPGFIGQNSFPQVAPQALQQWHAAPQQFQLPGVNAQTGGDGASTIEQSPSKPGLFRAIIDSIFKPAPADQTQEQHLLQSLQIRAKQNFRNHDSRSGDELVINDVKSQIDAAKAIGELFSPGIINKIATLPPTYGDQPVERYADSIANELANKMSDKDELLSQNGSNVNALNHLKSMASNPNEDVAAAAIRELIQLLNGDSKGYTVSRLLKPIEGQVRDHIAETLSENPLKVLRSVVPERHFYLRPGIEAKTIGEIAKMAVVHPATSADALKFIEKACHKFERETSAQWREVLAALQQALDSSKAQVAPGNQTRLVDALNALAEAQTASGKAQTASGKAQTQPAPTVAQQASTVNPAQFAQVA